MPTPPILLQPELFEEEGWERALDKVTVIDLDHNQATAQRL